MGVDFVSAGNRRTPAAAALLILTVILGLAVLWTGSSDSDIPAAGAGDTGSPAGNTAQEHRHPAPQPKTGATSNPGTEAPADAPDTTDPPATRHSSGASDFETERGAPDTDAGGAVAAAPGTTRQPSLADAAGAGPAGGVPRPHPSTGTPDRTVGLSERSPVVPEDALGSAPGLGGCLAEYGAAGQCLPVIPPSLASHVQDMADAGLDPSSMPHDWTCGEVRRYFPAGLPVRAAGIDPQGLDPTGDGTACGAAD